jgi:hypothetical protein
MHFNFVSYAFILLQSVSELNQQLVAAESDGGKCITFAFGSGVFPLECPVLLMHSSHRPSDYPHFVITWQLLELCFVEGSFWGEVSSSSRLGNVKLLLVAFIKFLVCDE